MLDCDLVELNKAQQAAVEHMDGPLLVVAGAGTGKTRVITHRIARLIEKGVRPNEILAVTFTNKAAGEMRERVAKIVGMKDEYQEKGVFVSTFHSLGVYILRQSGRALGISRWFSIFDRDDSRGAIKKAMKEKGVDPKAFEPKGILGAISRAKSERLTRGAFTDENTGNYYYEIVADVWESYEQILEAQKALDFDDLLLKTVELLRDHEAVRKQYQSTWKYLHVDEYQDTNKVQYGLIKLLAGDAQNVCVVGDSDQMVYSWRGATIKNILHFEKDFPGSTTVLLEENYRSTPTILAAANSVIKKNELRKEKNLFTKRSDGEKIAVYEAFDGPDEAQFVVETAKKLVEDGEKLSEIAILYRANFQSRVLEEAFLGAGVPYTLLGTRFFERREVRDVLSYVKAAFNREDLASIARTINVPRRGIGAKTVEKIFAGRGKDLPASTQKKVQDYYSLLDSFKDALTSKQPSDSLRYIVRHCGYEEMLKKGGEEEQERLENIRELVTLARKYDVLSPEEGVDKLLTDAALSDDQEALDRENKGKRGVRLMTVHAAKGLEFNSVFVVGLEQDLFPHTKMDEGVTKERLEEERRLFYVALTRARHKLYLSHASLRYIYGSQVINIPSEFITDIPDELLESVGSQIEASEYSPSRRQGGYLDDVIEIE